MTSTPLSPRFEVIYPESDGSPITESDITRDYLIYGIEALDRYFQAAANVYVSGNLFIYYEQGNPRAVVSPDVFVIFGVEKRKRSSYKTWEEKGKVPDFILEITSRTTASEDRGLERGLYAYLGKLLSPRELDEARRQAEQRAERLAAKLKALGIDPDLL